MTHDKIIFLDIDGVLNNIKSLPEPHIFRFGDRFVEDRGDDGYDDLYNRFDPDCVKEVNRIVEVTKAKIVVSSTWRMGDATRFFYLQRYLRSKGVQGKVIGRTPDIVLLPNGDVGVRGQEINRWLEQNPTRSFVILDDNSDMEPHMDHLVQTKFEPGLTAADADRAIEILQK